ncbi:MAG: hypothetical protein PUE08_05775 [Eubacteriales bacterium]|nr:hypothetical protein [Eubacteriales bacterium]
MDEERNIKKLVSIKKDYTSMIDLLSCAVTAASNDDEICDEFLKALVSKSEETHLKLRDYIAENICDIDRQKKFTDAEIENCRIKVELIHNGILKITMPIILPFSRLKSVRVFPRKRKPNEIMEIFERTNMIVKLLETVLFNFKKENCDPRYSFKNFTIYYKNIYATNNLRTIPDTDNYEYKQITDAIVRTFANGNDSFENADFVLTSCLGTETKTEIYLIPNQNVVASLDAFCAETKTNSK